MPLLPAVLAVALAVSAGVVAARGEQPTPPATVELKVLKAIAGGGEG